MSFPIQQSSNSTSNEGITMILNHSKWESKKPKVNWVARERQMNFNYQMTKQTILYSVNCVTGIKRRIFFSIISQYQFYTFQFKAKLTRRGRNFRESHLTAWNNDIIKFIRKCRIRENQNIDMIWFKPINFIYFILFSIERRWWCNFSKSFQTILYWNWLL